MQALYRASCLLLSFLLVSCAVTSPRVLAPTAVVAQKSTAQAPIRIPDAVISPENAQAVTVLKTYGRGSINDLAWSPDGTQIAVAASVGIFLANAATYEERWLPDAHSANSIAFSPDGSLLASAEGSTVRVWDLASGKELRALTGHTDVVNSVAYSPAGDLLASGSQDKTVKLWDAASGKDLHTLEGHDNFVYRVEFSPNGKLLLTSAYEEPSKLWDTASGKELRALRKGQLVFSPDGSTLASGYLAGQEETIWFWDVESGAALRALQGSPGEGTAKETLTPDERVYHNNAGFIGLAYSPDGALLAAKNYEGNITLWDTANGKPLHVLKSKPGGLFSLVFSPDGERIASSSMNAIRIWEVASGQELHEFTAQTEIRGEKGLVVQEGFGDPVNCLAFSPDGRTLAAGNDLGTVKLYAVTTGELLAAFEADIGFINSIAFSPDGKMLAAGGGRYNPIARGVQIWDVETQKTVFDQRDFSESVNSLSFSPDGATLAVGWGNAWGTGAVDLWDVGTGELRSRFGLSYERNPKFQPAVMSVAFNPAGALLAAANSDGRVLVWDMQNEQEKAVYTVEHGTMIPNINQLAFSPDGATLAAAIDISENTGEIRLWDTATGTERMRLEGHTISARSVAYSPDGRVLASTGMDSAVRLWDAETGAALAVLDVPSVASAVFSPDGKLLATGGYDFTIRLWGVPGSSEPGQ